MILVHRVLVAETMDDSNEGSGPPSQMETHGLVDEEEGLEERWRLPWEEEDYLYYMMNGAGMFEESNNDWSALYHKTNIRRQQLTCSIIVSKPVKQVPG